MSARHAADEVPVDVDEIRHAADEILVDVVCNSIHMMLDLAQLPREKVSTIFKVSDEIRNEDPEAYKPQMVSIGPFHRGDPQLLPTERIKLHFLQDLIDRHPYNKLSKYVRAVSLTPNVSSCYSEDVIGNGGMKRFLETMVLDGCFVIEFLVKCYFAEPMGELEFVVGSLSRLKSDLLLIENQVPFLVLQHLFDMSHIPGRVSLVELALSLLSSNMSHERELIPEVVYHLLHLYHSSVPPTGPLHDPQARSRISQIMNTMEHMFFEYVFLVLSFLVPYKLPPKYEDGGQWASLRPITNATELYQSGITFERRRLAGCNLDNLDVTFRDSDGVMEIPLLDLTPTTVSRLRNLVAFEQHIPECGNQFRTYMELMDSLIDTPADVELLVKSGVLNDNIGGHDQVARFFNNFGKLAYPNYGYNHMGEMLKRVKKYSMIKRHRWKARMMHDYFSNPWSAISLFAAILLLLLTMLQTFFAVYAYVRPP